MKQRRLLFTRTFSDHLEIGLDEKISTGLLEAEKEATKQMRKHSWIETEIQYATAPYGGASYSHTAMLAVYECTEWVRPQLSEPRK